MTVNYVSDTSGATIAVQIPIDEWNNLKEKLPNTDTKQEDEKNNLPKRQKNMLDKRLQSIAENPDRLRPIEELFEELDSNED